MPTLVKPMSLAYSRKHWRQTFSPYFRISPHWLEQTRLRKSAKAQDASFSQQYNASLDTAVLIKTIKRTVFRPCTQDQRK